jgi:Na+-driven multidrug efflux pump
MIAMIAGFLTNMLLDYVFVWELDQGVAGAAIATIIGQGVTMLIALVYLLRKKQFTLHIAFSKLGRTAADIIKVGIAPFGLAMSPNISLIIINRFSMSYGGEKAIATYACIAYIICIIFMLVFMLILPPLFGGQIMIWWSTVNARILSALLALLLKQRVDKEDLYKGGELA